ncbi:MAG: DsbA family protein [Caldimonas sp.]
MKREPSDVPSTSASSSINRAEALQVSSTTTMRTTPSNLLSRLLLAAMLATGGLGSSKAADTTGAAPADPALVDAIVRKLESDGSLDRAVEKAMTRVVQRQDEARRASEAQRRAQLQEQAKVARKVTPGRDHIRGDAAAEVSIVEYSDFECPFCKRFHATPSALLQRHGKRVNWVFRHFPLAFHDPAARREAVASECAARLGGNEIFWKYTDALFAATRSNGQGLAEGTSEQSLAAQLKLDPTAFAACLRDPQSDSRVAEDLADGTAAGITGTPTTLIRNNRTGKLEVVVGAQPPEAFDAAIARALDARQ